MVDDEVMSVVEATKNLNDLAEEYKTLSDRLAAIQAEENDIRARMRELNGFHGGLIPHAKRDLERAQQAVKDKDLTKVVWDGVGPNGNWVVERVTPKRIYVKRIGDYSASEQFDRKGKAVRKYTGYKIDLEKTPVTG